MRFRGHLAIFAFVALGLGATDSAAAPASTLPTKRPQTGNASPPSKPKVGKAKTGPTRVETRTVYVPCWEMSAASKPGTWSSRACRPAFGKTARLRAAINLPVGKDRAKLKALRCKLRNDAKVSKVTFKAQVGAANIPDAVVAYTGTTPPVELRGTPPQQPYIDPLTAPIILRASYRLDPVGKATRKGASLLVGCFVDYTVSAAK